MISNLSDDLKKLLLAGIGAAAMTGEKSKEFLDELIKKGELTLEQGKTMNDELLRKIREELTRRTQSKPSKGTQEILDSLDNLTQDDIEKIKEKLSSLEMQNDNDTGCKEPKQE